MSQTVNGQKNTAQKSAPQRQYRPGQRQQERLQRIARRKRRQRLISAAIAAVFLIVASSLGVWQYQRYTAQQLANSNATATTVAKNHASATTTALNATATVVTKDCFISPTGQPVPGIYAAQATPTAGPATAPALAGTPVTLSDGLKYVDIKVGTGAAAKKNSKVTVEYSGWLASTCQKFSSSYDNKGQTFPVALGQGQVIKGWDEGLVGMKAGGIRRLYIPAALAYGANPPQGSNLPANADLIFDVTALSVK